MAGQCGGAREGEGGLTFISCIYTSVLFRHKENHLRLKLFKNVKNSEEMLEFVLELQPEKVQWP